METLPPRLAAQSTFLLEVDKLKQVVRRNFIGDGSRRETTAEHSWHIIVVAMTLWEYRRPEVSDLARVLELLAVHDLVEIYAGDVFFFDEKGNEGKFDRELAAAHRLFGLLPADLAQRFLDLWLEFEKASTPEGVFAAAVDRLAPVLLNTANGGQSWREAGISAAQVRSKMANVGAASPALGELLDHLVESSITAGHLKP